MQTKGLVMNMWLTANNNETARIARFTGFVVLVVVTMFLASQVGQIAAEGVKQPGMANIYEIQRDILEDSIQHFDQFCYKSCTFTR